MQDGLSVILCCYNSATRLPETLAFLAGQENVLSTRRELIVVDNASSDSSSVVAQRVWSELGSPYPLSVIREDKMGLAWARRTGVMNAQFNSGVFCDDDNWLSPSYLDTVYLELIADDGVGAVGGRSVPASDDELPSWFFNVAPSFAVGVQSFEQGNCTSRGFLWGAGLGVRLDALKVIYQSGVEPLSTGRKGKELSSGDDSELCQWLIFAGLRLHYNADLTFRHFLPPEKLSEDYLEKFFSAQGDVETKASSAYFSVRFRPFLRKDNYADSPTPRSLVRSRSAVRAVLSILFLVSKPRLVVTIIGNERLIVRAMRRGVSVNKMKM